MGTCRPSQIHGLRVFKLSNAKIVSFHKIMAIIFFTRTHKKYMYRLALILVGVPLTVGNGLCVTTRGASTTTNACESPISGAYGFAPSSNHCAQCEYQCAIAPDYAQTLTAPWTETDFVISAELCGTSTHQISETGCGFMWLSPCYATANNLERLYCRELVCSTPTPLAAPSLAD